MIAYWNGKGWQHQELDRCAFCAVYPADVVVRLRDAETGEPGLMLVVRGEARVCPRCRPLLEVRNWSALGARANRVARRAGNTTLDDQTSVAAWIGEQIEFVGD